MKTLVPILLTIIIVLSVFFSFSQQWPKYYSQNNSYDYSEDIIEMYDNGYLMSGNYSSYDGTEYKTWSWLIKTDINGNILWDKIIEGGDQIMETNAAEQTMDGGILTCGWVWSEIGNYDPFVMKLDVCGEKEWCTIFASSTQTNPWAQDIVETSSGDIIVLVNQYGYNNVEDMDLFKLDSQGKLLWRKTYCSGSVYPEGALPLGRKVIITSQENYLISGDVYWEDPWNPGGVKPLRSLFVLIDSTGTENWVLPFGINDTILSQALSIIEVEPNRFIGIGANIPEGYKEGLIIELNNFGNVSNFAIINAKKIDSIFNRLIFYDAFFVDTLFVFGGVIGVEAEGNPTMETMSDTNLFNYISFNNYIQYTDFITPYSLYKTSDKLLSNSTFKQTGNWDIALSKLNLNLEYDTLDPGIYTYDNLCTSPGLPQSGFIYLDDCDIFTGVDIPSPEEYYAGLQTIPVKTFPNPASQGTITFEFENTKHHTNIELKCFGIYGKEVFKDKVYRHQGKSIVDIGGWQKGMYIAVVYSNGLPVGQCKFVVQ